MQTRPVEAQTETDIAVIIIGLNAMEYVRCCLESLRKADWHEWTHEVIYVDNGSSDGTLDMLANFPEVRVIANSENLGFCRAGNQGAELARSRHYLFLNDDTLVLDDAVPLLADLLRRMPAVGVVASRLLYPDRSEQYSGRRFPSIWNGIFGRRSILTRLFPGNKPASDYLYKEQLQGQEAFPVEWVSAAAMMVRKEAFDAIGGLAEDYYYWHEAVFCDRLSRADWLVYLHPRSIIIHHEGKGSGPRPFRVRKWHILDFHKAAYRCYCEHYALGRFSLQRWFAAAALAVRAACLLATHRVATLLMRADASS